MERTAYRSNRENLMDYLHLFSLYLKMLEDGQDREAAQKQAAALDMQIIEREKRPCPEPLAFPLLRKRFGLSRAEAFCLLSAFCCEIDGTLRNRLQALSGSPVPTFDLALSLCQMHRPIGFDALFACLDPWDSPLGDLLRQQPAPYGLMSAPLLLRPGILSYLTSGRLPSSRWYTLWEPAGDGAYLPLHLQALESVQQYLSSGAERGGFFVLGPDGSGRRTLIHRACSKTGRRCASIDLARISGLEEPQIEQAGRELSVVLRLSDAALCVLYGTHGQRSRLEALLGWLRDWEGPLFLVGEGEAEPHPLPGRPCPLSVRIGNLSDADYETAWRAYGGASAQGIVPDYRLTVGQVERVWGTARHLCALRGQTVPDARIFADAIRALHPDSAEELQRPRITLDDLVLNTETSQKLRLLCGYARQRRRVFQEWGFAQRFAGGRGISALFCGGPGTGKTMAANAVAEELGMPLMRIDLSQTLDKYIGETEKKLDRAFAQAQRRNAILFFDEADALFSRRTEVSSSSDRYANAETAFLLQAVEQYEGIVLLATNLMGNFDPAFLRRIRLVIRFPMPDGPLRLSLWRSAFPAGAPLGEGVDLELLAREIELSPATIQTAALSAAVLAAGENQPVSMQHLLFAIRSELEKSGASSRLQTLEALLA